MIQPTKWSVPLGSGADVQELPDDDLKFASFSKIFPQITQVPLSAGGVAPRRIDFNSLFKLLADNIYYYQNGGVFEYSDTADYERGAIVKYNDNIYLCIQDNSALNVHNPEDMDYWLRVALNNELADYLPLVGGNVTGNLTVQNKNVVRSVNGVEADASGNVSTLPDYSAGVTINSVPYTAPSNGLISVKTIRRTSAHATAIIFNGVTIMGDQNKAYSELWQNALINKGQVVTTAIDVNTNTLTFNGTTLSLTFYPLKVVS